MTNESLKLLLFHKKCCNKNTHVGLIKGWTSAQDCTSEKLLEICDGRVSPSLRDSSFNFFPKPTCSGDFLDYPGSRFDTGRQRPMKENVRVVFRVRRGFRRGAVDSPRAYKIRIYEFWETVF